MGNEAGTAKAEVTLQSTAFNRSTLERAVVSGAERYGLGFRVRDAERSLVRRDFTVQFWGAAESVAEFADWLEGMPAGRARGGDAGGPGGPG